MRSNRPTPTRVPLLLVGGALLLMVACGGPQPASPASRASTDPARERTGASPADASKVPALTAPDTALPEGPKVIRTAEATLQVRKDGLDAAWHRLDELVTAAGGYPAGAEAQSQADGLRSTSLTYQVPSDRFQSVMSDLKRLGTMENLHLSGNDVSDQYVDLRARLKSLEQERAAMEALLGRATSIQEIISVRQQLAPIQQQIEQIQGRLNHLDHATAFSSLGVKLHEPAAASAPRPADEWGLRTALSEALHNFVGTINFLIVALGTVGPFLIFGLGGALIVFRRRLRSGRRTEGPVKPDA